MTNIDKFTINRIKQIGALINYSETSSKQNIKGKEFRNIEKVILKNLEITKCSLKH